MAPIDLGARRIHESDFDQANQRGATRRSRLPPAVAARYDEATTRVVVTLSTGLELACPTSFIQGLADAESSMLTEIDITPTGLGLRFPRADVDVDMVALLAGCMGSRRWMALLAARRSGGRYSVARAEAARANGRRHAKRQGKQPAAVGASMENEAPDTTVSANPGVLNASTSSTAAESPTEAARSGTAHLDVLTRIGEP